MFIFVDETGNTGKKLDDPAQPIFMTAALMARTDFDKVHGGAVHALARDVGVPELHANELGTENIEALARPLLRTLKKADARFFISRVEKRYLLATKIVDTIFDSGENFAVPWHIYNLRPLRMMIVFKLASFLPEDLALEFWASMMDKKEDRARLGLVDFCERVLNLAPTIRDGGFRERVEQAFSWARDNPEAIYLHSSGKVARNGHLPNVVAFGNLLDGIERQSQVWRKPIRLIRHDRQMEFESSLRFWHEMFSQAPPDIVELPLGERLVIRKAFGSEFRVSSASDSAGIQVVDVVLWLFRRLSNRKAVGPDSADLMTWIFRRAYQNDFSFDGVGRSIEERFGQMMQGELSPEQEAAGRELLNRFEQDRLKKIEEYAANRLSAAGDMAVLA